MCENGDVSREEDVPSWNVRALCYMLEIYGIKEEKEIQKNSSYKHPLSLFLGRHDVGHSVPQCPLNYWSDIAKAMTQLINHVFLNCFSLCHSSKCQSSKDSFTSLLFFM